MKVEISKDFTFDSAHKLDWHKGKCNYLHGHTYKLRVTITSKLNQNGIIMDFGNLKEIVNKYVIERLDHKYLNNIYANPTAEIMAVDIFKRLKERLQSEDVKLTKITLWETPTSFVEVTA